LLSKRAAAVTVLTLAGVMAATTDTSVWSPPQEGVGYVSELLTIVALSFAATFAVAGALTLLGRETRDAAWRRALPPTVVVAVLVSLFGISRTPLHLEAPALGAEQLDSEGGRLGVRLRMDWRGPAVRNAEEAPGIEGALPASPGRVQFARILLLVAGLTALALVLRSRGRRRAHTVAAWDPDDDRTRVAAHAAVIHSIDAMLAAPDNRTAIIGAYARLLEELEAIGASRRSYEGPTEHLHRVLSVLEVGPVPLRTLVRLFEVARFSEHSLNATHREEALGALREVARSLSADAISP
jgi:hypothetical protein